MLTLRLLLLCTNKNVTAIQKKLTVKKNVTTKSVLSIKNHVNKKLNRIKFMKKCYNLHVKIVKSSAITKHVKTNAKSNVLNVKNRAKTTVKTNVKTAVTHAVNTTTNKYSKMFKIMSNRSLFHVVTATTNNVQIAQIATAIKAY